MERLLYIKLRPIDRPSLMQRLWNLITRKSDVITLALYYNIADDGYHYQYNGTTSTLRKDLSRTLEMFVKILDRYKTFDYEVVEMDNNIISFVRTVTNSFDRKHATYLISGSTPYQVELAVQHMYTIEKYDPESHSTSNLTSDELMTILTHKLGKNTSYGIDTDDVIDSIYDSMEE